MKSYSYIIENPPKGQERSYQLAKQMIPVLISWAQEKRSPQYYGTLSKAIGHGRARIGTQLYVVAKVLSTLSEDAHKDVPLLNALLINKGSKRPNDGLGAVMDGYDGWDEKKKRQEAENANKSKASYYC